jgi:hypothetical protein
MYCSGSSKGGNPLEDLRDKITSGMNFLERLMSKIPGFEGYQNREQARNADKIQRIFMAKSLREEKSRLQNTAGMLLRSGNLSLMTEIDRITKLFDKVSDRIEHAEYGYAGLFASVKVNEQELDNIYEFDLGMLDDIAGITEAVTALEGSMSMENVSPEKKLREVEQKIIQLDRKVDERHRILKGVQS